MTYYNPSVYNYANLDEQDQLVVKNAVRLIQSVDLMKVDYEIDELDTSTMERIYNETANEVMDAVIERLSTEIIEYIVSRIDTYNHAAEEYDTDDYLFGMDEFVIDDSDNFSTN